MTTQHTSGTWRVSAGNETEIMADKRNVARAHCGGMSGVGLAEAEDNARLIAAAPDLLAALEELCLAPNKHRPEEYWEAARAAITKAKGQ